LQAQERHSDKRRNRAVDHGVFLCCALAR